jgi:hypothetical protein
MKKLGYLLIALGLALLLVVIINLIKENSRLVSPLPEKDGVKVILITPSP